MRDSYGAATQRPAPQERSGRQAAVRVAIIDDDSGFLAVLAKRMGAAGWEQRVSASAVPIEALSSMRLSALVVDVELLGPRAWDYLQRVCAELPSVALVVCTGRSTVAQRVRGLRVGADDWLTKPTHPEEVIARIEAVIRRRTRRGGAERAEDPSVKGELEIRPDQFQAFVAGRSLDLTRREFELLELLAAADGRVLEREEIYERVWGYAMARGDRSVDVFVRKLRQKLSAASPGWHYIHTHFGIGYRFDAEPEGGESELDAAGVADEAGAEAGVEAAEAPLAARDERGVAAVRP